MRTTLCSTMIDLADAGLPVYWLTCDIGAFSMKGFADKYPKQFRNLGVCEQNAVGIAAGLALTGKIPYVHSIDPFLTARAYESIRVNAGLNNLPVKIVTVGDSLAYPRLGPTHSCPEGIALMRNIPNLKISVPTSKASAIEALKRAATRTCPEYIRLSLATGPVYTPPERAKTLILAIGTVRDDLIKLAQEHKISAEIPDTTDIYDWDKAQWDDCVVNTYIDKVVVVEESYQAGGLGELATYHLHRWMRHLAFQLEFDHLCLREPVYAYGSLEQVKQAVGLGQDALLGVIT